MAENQENKRQNQLTPRAYSGGQRTPGALPRAARHAGAAAAQQKTSGARQGAQASSKYGRYSRGRKGPDWAMILALAVIAVILLGVIALIAIGVNSCASGCNSQTVQTASAKPQIREASTQTPTTAPENTPYAAQPQETQSPPPASQAPVSSAPSGELKSLTVRNIGDFVVHDVIFQSAAKLAVSTGVDYPYNFSPMLNYIRDVMGNADLTVTNVDGSLGGKQYYKYGYSGYPQFNTPPYILYALKDAGVDMLTLANNHMLDGWFDGLKATVTNVESLGLKHVGASRTQEEHDTPVMYELNGIKVGFINYTEALNSMDSAKGLDPDAMKYGVHAVRNSNAFNDAKALRDLGADVIVCYMHWGTEYEADPDANQQKVAKALVSAGVDVIIGGHPHVVQCAKWLNGTNQFGEDQRTLCLYSMGNFLSDQRLQYRDGGIIFDFTIQEQADGTYAITAPSYLPTWVWRTGTESSGFTYNVIPAGQYLNQRPSGMSDTDYSRMLASYQESVAAMSKGVGTLISE